MKNNLSISNTTFTTSYKAFVYTTIVLTSLIFLHSNYIHYGKSYHFVRLCTEVGSIALIVAATLLLQNKESNTDDMYKWDILINFVYCGLGTLLIQLCDNQMFYRKFKAVTKVSYVMKISISLYIFLILVCTWLPAYTIVPFFFDTNSGYFSYWKNIGVNIRTWGHLLFNFALSSHFNHRCLRGLSCSSITSWKLKTIAARNTVHCLLSSMASLLYLFLHNKRGVLAYDFIVIFTFHFVFNYKTDFITDMCFSRKVNPDSPSSAESGTYYDYLTFPCIL